MTENTNVFDPTLYPALDNVRDRNSVRPEIERVYYGEGDLTQGADVNEAFTIEANRRRDIGNLIAADGDRLSGGDITVDQTAGTVTVSDGVLYILGAKRSIAGATLTAVPMTGDVDIGVRRVINVITAEDDPIYLGLVSAAEESYGEAGAIRTSFSFSWAFDTDGGAGDFFPYVKLRDGSILAQDAPPTLSGVQQQLATYDYDAHENYVVRGCSVAALGLVSGSQIFVIGEGVANIMGFKTSRPSSTRFLQPEDPDIGQVDAEPQTFADGGTGTTVFTVRRPPIAAVETVIVTKQRTVTVVKGNTGSLDALPDDSVTSVLSVVQGATTYATPASYSQSGDAIQWTGGGAQPTTGSSYQVTYRYLDAVTPDSVTDTTITASGGVTGGQAFLSYSFKLPRVDKICLDQNGVPVYIKGVSAQTQPQPPQVPTTVLALATVTNAWVGTPSVKNDGIHAYPFPLIDRMFNKLLDGLDQIGLLRQKLDINYRSAGAADGIFSDPLTSDYYRDAGEAQNGAVFNGSFQIPIVPTFRQITMAGTMLLNFAQETVVQQTLVSGCEKINPYQAFSPLPATISITPSEDYWTQQQTQWLSEQTQVFGSGNTERVVDTEVLTSVTDAPIRYLRQIPIAFTISHFGAGEVLSHLYFDNIDVTPAGPLVANSSGIINGSFTIPANVNSGAKLVAAVGGSGASCGALFTGQGILEIISLQQVTTVQRYQVDPPKRAAVVVVPTQTGAQNIVFRRGGPDPQAQSFSLDQGRHVSSVDIKFCNIGNRAQPVIVELVTMENGFPTTTTIAQAEISMASVIANAWTRFTFPVPIYLPENQYFAFVVKSNDPNHAISVADRGQFDASQQKWITAQPYVVGTRFSSSNAVSWTVHQDSDITFRLNCARFNPLTRTIQLGVFAVTNCSDLIMRGDIFLPTADTSVQFQVTFGSEVPVTIIPDQVLERTSFFTGNVTIAMILKGSALVTPVVQKDLLAIFGTMQANGVYICRGFPIGTAVKFDAVMSTKLPAGSTLVVDCDAENDTWVNMPAINSTVIDDGYIETTFEKNPFTAPVGARLRLTLTGTPAARPTVADIRAFSI